MDLSIQPIGASLRQNSAPKGPGGPPNHENVIRQFGQSLTEEQRTSILTKVSELQESGASFEAVSYTHLRAKEGLVDLVVDHSAMKVSFLN